MKPGTLYLIETSNSNYMYLCEFGIFLENSSLNHYRLISLIDQKDYNYHKEDFTFIKIKKTKLLKLIGTYDSRK